MQYAGFDGELAEEVRAFDAAVTAAGWGDSSPHISEPIHYYERFRGTPQGPRTYDAGDVPGVSYVRWLGERHTVGCGGSKAGSAWILRQRWLEAGQPLSLAERGRPERGGIDGPPVYEDRDPLDHEQAKTAALAQHRYLAVITLSVQCGYDPGD